LKLRGTMTVKENHLFIGGCDAVELARRFGTPLYVLDEAHLRSQARAYIEGFSRAYPDFKVVYAGKALLTAAICRIIEEEGLYLDVVSGGELYTALFAGFPADRIVFHGNNKSPEELQMALEHGVHRIVVDNLYELELLDAFTRRSGARASILLRVTPGVEAHTHSYIQTGQIDSKFGFGLAGGQAYEATRRALALERVELAGFHCHIGSQIFDLRPFEAAVQVMFGFFDEVRRGLGFVPRELDLGGGLGIRYVEGDVSVDPKFFAEQLAAAVRREAERLGFPLPTLMVEPGRSIVGEAGTTLYTVGSVKEIPGLRTYVAVDGGMADNPRVALYQASYEAVVANKAAEPPSQVVSVAGKYCESGDMLIWDLKVPPLEPGDILAVLATGAYNYSMASNYNRIPRPAMVLVADGAADVIVERETYADLVRLDRIPARLRDARDEAAAARDRAVASSDRERRP